MAAEVVIPTVTEGNEGTRDVRVPARVVGPLVVAVGVIAVGLVGLGLTRSGVHLHEGSLFVLAGRWTPHLTAWALPAVAVAALTVGYATTLAARLRFGWLLAGAVALAGLWAFTVALVGGPASVAAPLAETPEYLHDVPRVHAGFLREFTGRIIGPDQWTTHVGGHPPLMVALFALLAAAGLGGAGWAAALVIAVGATTAASVVSTVRLLAGEATARRAAPFVAVSPLALWIATSADAFFAGVAAAALCALAHANARRGPRSAALAAVSGILFGACAFLSYGLVLLAIPAVALTIFQSHLPPVRPAASTVDRRVTPRRIRRIATAVRRARFTPLLIAACGVMVVAAGFAAAGFWWWAGFRETRLRVMVGLGYRDRPAPYFWFADLAALAVSVGPAVVAAAFERRPWARATADPAGREAIVARGSSGPVPDEPGRKALKVLPGGGGPAPDGLPWNALNILPSAALVAIAVATFSSLAKGEVERIFLPFAVWLLPLAARLGSASRQLAAQCAFTLLIALTTTLFW